MALRPIKVLLPTPSQPPQVVWLGQGKADSPSTGRAGRSGDAECLGDRVALRGPGNGQVFFEENQGKIGSDDGFIWFYGKFLMVLLVKIRLKPKKKHQKNWYIPENGSCMII